MEYTQHQQELLDKVRDLMAGKGADNKKHSQKIKELEAQKKELEAQIRENTDMVKELMESKMLEEVEVGEYTVRWAALAASRFDSTAFKKEHAELYKTFTKQVASKRFSIA